MNVVYLVSVSDRINLFKVCTYLHLNCDDWFTQWQKEACQQHGKSLPISSWDAAEEVVASAIYGGGYYVSLKFSIMSNVSLPSNISAVCNTWNWRSSVGSKGCSALSRSKESFTRALLSKIISRNPSSKSPSIWKVYWLMLSWPKCAARFLISTTSGLCLAQRRGDFILVSNDFMVTWLLTNWFIGINVSNSISTGLETHAFWHNKLANFFHWKTQ